MPLFNFKCADCGHVFEAIRKSYVGAIPCEKCSAIAKKQVSAPGGFVLRGEGFYNPTNESNVIIHDKPKGESPY